MTKSETFILNIRTNSDTTGVFKININIPELRRYNRYKLFVKDFIVINTDTVNALPDVISLCSNTLSLINNYDNYGTEELKSPSATLLAVVSSNTPFTNDNYETNFNVLSVNGTHLFWLENFSTRTIITGGLVDAFFSLAVTASM